MPPLETEDRKVAGRYRLATLLGKGGMGRVWRARDEVLQRDVAVKEVSLPATLSEADKEAARARVLREARTAASLVHPSAVTIFDAVEEDGKGFVVMELVEAPTLQEVVSDGGPLPTGRAVHLARALIDVLEAAHARGIVHRDVKPGNVMCPEIGSPKLADFGIATVQGDPTLTASGTVLGSPCYMAPEQATGERGGPATDAWALGATLYYAVEGEPPFDKGAPIPTLASVVNDPIPEPVRAGPLEPIVTGLLQKDPERRLSLGEARGLLGADGSRTRAATVPEIEPATVPAEPVPERDASAVRPWLFAAAWVALVAALVLVGFALMRSTDGTQGSEEAEGSSGSDLGSDWRTFEEPGGAFRISYPRGWQVEPADENTFDFQSPDPGTYVRIEWTDSPGSDPVAAWEGLASSFAAEHENYEEIRIEPSTFKGFEAADWEFTYFDGGLYLHALDIGFVTESRGYALFFQTTTDSWDESSDVLREFEGSFEVPD